MRRRLFSSFASQNNTTFPLLSWNRRRPCLIQPSAEVGLLGICEDRNSSFKQGSSAAPSLIRKYFREPAVNTWCELGFDVDKHIVDYGDVVPLTNDHAGIEAASSASLRKILEAGLVPLTLGGDHSISFSTIKTIRKHIGQPLVIIHFDAHPDIYEHYNGNLNSHACPFARVLEVPGLCAQLISIGVRTISGEQFPMLEKYQVEVVEARDFPAKGSDVLPLLKHFIPTPDTPVYLTIDLDVLDPSAAPGVSHREGGGLSSRQVIDAIHSIPGKLVGADLVEYNPTRDTTDFLTASVAAKLMKEMAGKLITSQHQQ